MATNKFFKSLLFTFTIAISLFGFSVENSFAYPVFAQQGYAKEFSIQKLNELIAIVKVNKRLLKNLLVAMN